LTVRKSSLFVTYLLLQIILLGLLFAYSSYREKADGAFLLERSELVKKLDLTDLCLVTEVSYTRHLTQADLHAPFQDHPFALEHFPSGSIFRPPDSLKRVNGKLD
jgi:hypothetical protein